MAVPNGSEDARKLAEETIDLNRRIIEQTQEPVGEEDIGVSNFGREGAVRRLTFIFQNLPLSDPIENQTAYLLRAVMCAQIFNDGNKRTAVVLGIALAQRSGYRIVVPEDELYEFILRRFGDCPRWPMRDEDILARDRMFLDIAGWFRNRLERV